MQNNKKKNNKISKHFVNEKNEKQILICTQIRIICISIEKKDEKTKPTIPNNH